MVSGIFHGILLWWLRACRIGCGLMRGCGLRRGYGLEGCL